MLDIDKLEAEREAATIDKADLFDFYHKHWDELVAELKRSRPPFAAKQAEDRLHRPPISSGDPRVRIIDVNDS